MKYDFTSIMDRMGKDAIAVEALGQNPMAPKPPKEGFDVIPMWVADMNFPTVPTIPEAMHSGVSPVTSFLVSCHLMIESRYSLRVEK